MSQEGSRASQPNCSVYVPEYKPSRATVSRFAVSDGHGGESQGHESGRRIVEILGKKKSDHTDDDIDHMRKVNGYVKRHLKQRPTKDVEDSKWRYSLMNWGHDPLK